MVDAVSKEARELSDNKKYVEVNQIIKQLQVIKKLNLIDNIQKLLTIDENVAD